MKILKQNIRQGEVVVRVESLDDLWYLSNIIDPGDFASGKTQRKIKIGKEEQRKQDVVKRTVTIEIKVEKIEFHKSSNVLRVSGIITKSPEDVPKGVHHTFNLEEGSSIKIIKEEWLRFQLDKLKEAATVKIPKILVCVLDRENVLFALLERSGYKILKEFQGEVQKKDFETKKDSQFYDEIARAIKDYNERYGLEYIIIASPAFWKEDLLKILKEESIRKKVVQATCSSSGEDGLKEVLKRPEVNEVLKQDRISREMMLVETLLKEISKNNLAAYGIKETELAVQAGAVDKLLITDSLIQKAREQGTYKQIDTFMKLADKMKGSIIIISSEHDGGKKLNGLGGIGAILRYKIK